MPLDCDEKNNEINYFDDNFDSSETKNKLRMWEQPIIRQKDERLVGLPRAAVYYCNPSSICLLPETSINPLYNSLVKYVLNLSYYHRVLCPVVDIFKMLVMLCPISCMFSAGVALGTPTVMIPQILENKSFELTKEMQSWLYSVHGIATWPAVFTLPFLSKRFGRRPVFLSGIISICIGWIVEYLAKSFLTLLIAEVFQGYAMGTNVVLGVFILSEYADPKYRGAFLLFKSASFIWGIWIGNAIGTFADSSNICFVGLLAGLLSFVILVYIPESPVWLAGEGNYEKCKNSFTWLRGSSKESYAEFQEMFDFYSNVETKKKENDTVLIRFLKLYRVIVSKKFYMPFLLSLVLFALYQFTGKLVITMYSLVIVKQVTNDTALAYKTMLLIDGISVIGMYVGCYLGHRFKRRLLLFTTTSTAIIIMFILSTLLFLKDNNVCIINNFAVLGLLLLYSLFISIGPISMCSFIYAEIIPHRFKISMTILACAFQFGLLTLMVKTNMVLMAKIGVSGIFCAFAICSSMCMFFLFCYLPETHNKTLSEIERYFISYSGGFYKNNESKWDKTRIVNTSEEA